MKEKLGMSYPDITADAGYESEEAYTFWEEEKQISYIKPQTYERWKKRSLKQDISKRENMAYDEKTDTCTCHKGNQLRTLYVKKRKVTSDCIYSTSL